MVKKQNSKMSTQSKQGQPQNVPARRIVIQAENLSPQVNRIGQRLSRNLNGKLNLAGSVDNLHIGEIRKLGTILAQSNSKQKFLQQRLKNPQLSYSNASNSLDISMLQPDEQLSEIKTITSVSQMDSESPSQPQRQKSYLDPSQIAQSKFAQKLGRNQVLSKMQTPSIGNKRWLKSSSSSNNIEVTPQSMAKKNIGEAGQSRMLQSVDYLPKMNQLAHQNTTFSAQKGALHYSKSPTLSQNQKLNGKLSSQDNKIVQRSLESMQTAVNLGSSQQEDRRDIEKGRSRNSALPDVMAKQNLTAKPPIPKSKGQNNLLQSSQELSFRSSKSPTHEGDTILINDVASYSTQKVRDDLRKLISQQVKAQFNYTNFLSDLKNLNSLSKSKQQSKIDLSQTQVAQNLKQALSPISSNIKVISQTMSTSPIQEPSPQHVVSMKIIQSTSPIQTLQQEKLQQTVISLPEDSSPDQPQLHKQESSQREKEEISQFKRFSTSQSNTPSASPLKNLASQQPNQNASLRSTNTLSTKKIPQMSMLDKSKFKSQETQQSNQSSIYLIKRASNVDKVSSQPESVANEYQNFSNRYGFLVGGQELQSQRVKELGQIDELSVELAQQQSLPADFIRQDYRDPRLTPVMQSSDQNNRNSGEPTAEIQEFTTNPFVLEVERQDQFTQMSIIDNQLAFGTLLGSEQRSQPSPFFVTSPNAQTKQEGGQNLPNQHDVAFAQVQTSFAFEKQYSFNSEMASKKKSMHLVKEIIEINFPFMNTNQEISLSKKLKPEKQKAWFIQNAQKREFYQGQISITQGFLEVFRDMLLVNKQGLLRRIFAKRLLRMCLESYGSYVEAKDREMALAMYKRNFSKQMMNSFKPKEGSSSRIKAEPSKVQKGEKEQRDVKKPSTVNSQQQPPQQKQRPSQITIIKSDTKERKGLGNGQNIKSQSPNYPSAKLKGEKMLTPIFEIEANETQALQDEDIVIKIQDPSRGELSNNLQIGKGSGDQDDISSINYQKANSASNLNGANGGGVASNNNQPRISNSSTSSNFIDNLVFQLKKVKDNEVPGSLEQAASIVKSINQQKRYSDIQNVSPMLYEKLRIYKQGTVVTDKKSSPNFTGGSKAAAASRAENSQTHYQKKSFNIIEDKYEESDEGEDANSPVNLSRGPKQKNDPANFDSRSKASGQVQEKISVPGMKSHLDISRISGQDKSQIPRSSTGEQISISHLSFYYEEDDRRDHSSQGNVIQNQNQQNKREASSSGSSVEENYPQRQGQEGQDKQTDEAFNEFEQEQPTTLRIIKEEGEETEANQDEAKNSDEEDKRHLSYIFQYGDDLNREGNMSSAQKKQRAIQIDGVSSKKSNIQMQEIEHLNKKLSQSKTQNKIRLDQSQLIDNGHSPREQERQSQDSNYQKSPLNLNKYSSNTQLNRSQLLLTPLNLSYQMSNNHATQQNSQTKLRAKGSPDPEYPSSLGQNIKNALISSQNQLHNQNQKHKSVIHGSALQFNGMGGIQKGVTQVLNQQKRASLQSQKSVLSQKRVESLQQALDGAVIDGQKNQAKQFVDVLIDLEKDTQDLVFKSIEPHIEQAKRKGSELKLTTYSNFVKQQTQKSQASAAKVLSHNQSQGNISQANSTYKQHLAHIQKIMKDI